MGFYIKPKDMSKEAFLDKHAMRIDRKLFLEFRDFLTHDKLPVCLVQNPQFSAAAIAYSTHEAEAFADPSDYRPKEYFLVSKKLLNEDVGVDLKAVLKLAELS